MPHFDLFGYAIFAFVTSITPGPNNYLLLAHGKNFGYKASMGILLGIFLGFTVVLLIAGYGIGQMVSKNETIALLLKIISSIWLLYLAFSLRKLTLNSESNEHKHVGFAQSFLLQFVNPKGWIMAIGAASAFIPTFSNVHINVLIFSFSFGLIGIPCMLTWLSFGDIISRIISSKRSNEILAYTLFLLMVSTIGFVWM